MKPRPALFSILLAIGAAAASAQSAGRPANQLRFCITSQPKTFDPQLVADDASETIRYLTGGVLVRLNRSTQQLEPALATSWQVDRGGRTIRFVLRRNVYFSDGTPFTAADVAWTMQRLMNPALHSPTGDAFRSGEGAVITQITGNDRIAITFARPVVGLDRLFDQVAIMSARSPHGEMAVLGPYYVAENHAGSWLLLQRNPHYWKLNAAGHPLPAIDSIRIDVEPNRDIEMLRFLHAEIDFINSVDAVGYDRLKARDPATGIDAGPSLDSEQIWFNQMPAAPLPDYKKAWFASTNFRRAISESIDRQALARVVFRGHAHPAISWISPADRYWFNARLSPHPYDPRDALRLLAQDGFQLRNGTLYDRTGHVVEFSVITNAGNVYREQMAAMIQQDLAAIGIRLRVVTLDFASLIERITRTFDYEACLLGLVNDELDPNAQMNVWLSSAENHQWNPSQRAPATPWEAEIDRLMRAQASTSDLKQRKAEVDRVQELVWQQEPFIYLVNKDALAAVSPRLRNVRPSVLRPQIYWNIDELSLDASGRGKR
ncbi:MAG: ABC transporter substrate-binding protein [Acidobacteriaceae bacterium]